MFLTDLPSRTKLGLGGALAGAGGLGMVLGAILGAPTLPWPWSFLSGFAVGLLSGLGVVLSLAGLLEHRR